MKQILLLLLIYGASACSEPELQRSIFLADPNFPELPQYSEWGYNTFGAYYDRQAFISNDFDVPLKVIREDGTLSLVFTGQLGPVYERHNSFSLRIQFSDFGAQNYQDLLTLHNTTLDLTDVRHAVIVNQDTAEILNGALHFVRVQHLIVDEVPEEVILSGVFEFQALVDELPVTVSNGRFDVGVGDFNFFNF